MFVPDQLYPMGARRDFFN